MLRLAVAIQGPVALVAIPLAIAQVARVQSRFADVFRVPIAGDQASFRKLFESYLPTNDPLALAGSVLGPTLSFAALLVLTVSLATLLLSPEEDRSIGGALRSVVRHAPAIAVPALVLCFGACVWVGLQVLWVEALSNLSPLAAGGFDSFGRMFSLIILADLGAAAVIIAAIYLAVRWAVAYPALVVERIGLRAALRRSSELTRGRRLKVALTLFVVAVVTSLVAGLTLSVAVALTGMVLDISSAPGLAVSSVPTIAASVLLAPFVPLTLVLLYRDLSAAGPEPTV
jgi:glycerophosphoryl diester phosphodiesterase family protein